jgi:hypothetical protein
MKKSLLGVLLLSLTSLLPLSVAKSASVAVPNAGFEIPSDKPLSGWTILNSDGSQSSGKVETTSKYSGNAALHISKTNFAGDATLRSEILAAAPKTQYQLSAQLNVAARSAANVYFRIEQFGVGSTSPNRGGLSGAVRPIYSTAGKWQELKFYFTTGADVDRVQIKLIFAQAPIDVLVDDVQLISLDPAEYKPRYDPPTPGVLLTQEDAEKILQQRPRATAEVRKVGARPRLFIDGKESVPLFYKSPGAWKLNRSQIGDFKNAGVNVYVISYFLSRGIYQTKPVGGWLGKDRTDFSELGDLMWQILRGDPQGYIMFDIVTDPYPAWGVEHPDDVVTNDKGQKAIVTVHDLRWGGQPQNTTTGYAERFGQSTVSRQLREDTSKVLTEFDQAIKNSVAGKVVIGYNVNGGDDTQFFAFGDRSRQFVDYSPAALEAFRDWLKVRYKNDAALQKAWHQPNVAFETAQIPTAQRQQASAFFLDPATEQDIIDHNRFHSEGIVDTRNIFARALRKSHGTPIIIGGYYAGPTVGVPSHRATGYQLQSGEFDFLTSVLGYYAPRLPGGPGKAHQAWSSLLLHDTIGLAEEDFRSWKSNPYDNNEKGLQFLARMEAAEESNAMIRRDTGHMLALGQGAWWFDMEGGWFSDPSIMKAVAESTSAYRTDFKDNSAPRAEVAVFVDEYSLDCINRQNTWTYQNALSEQIRQLNSSGVPFHIYLQSDLENAALPDYKLYVFLNAYHLTPNNWQALQKLRSGGKTLCFMHAPGIISEGAQAGSTPDAAAAIARVTGIAVQANDSQNLLLRPEAGSTLGGDALVSYSTSGFTYGHNQTRSPFAAPTFSVTDADAKPLAVYESSGKTAVALRDFGNWKSVFYGGIGLDAFFFNALAREAGAWVAAPAGNAVYANQNFLTIHALSPGEKIVQLLEPSKVTDLTDGKIISARTQSLKFPMKLGETRWFSLQQP